MPRMGMSSSRKDEEWRARGPHVSKALAKGKEGNVALANSGLVHLFSIPTKNLGVKQGGLFILNEKIINADVISFWN